MSIEKIKLFMLKNLRKIVFVAIFVLLLPLYFRNALWLWSHTPALITNQWWLVLFYIFVFCSFVLFLPKRKGLWKKARNIYVGFVIALFTEMFGVPLTLYFFSYFASPSLASPLIVYEFWFFEKKFQLLLTSFIAGIATIFGFVLIALGWREIYKSKSGLVTKGIYAFSRHPQYLGIILIVLFWTMAWPTLLTISLGSILIFCYVWLAIQEEKELAKKFGKKFLRYKAKVPMFI